MKTLIFASLLSVFGTLPSSAFHRNTICLVSPSAVVRGETRVENNSNRDVLNYLRDMMEYARMSHRHDLVEHYQESWLTVAEQVLGPLPARLPNHGFPASSLSTGTSGQGKAGEGQNLRTPPKWRAEILSRPWRKIIARDGEMEILECGHRCYHTEVPGSPDAKRRRCWDCAAQARQKKPATSAAVKAKAVRA